MAIRTAGTPKTSRPVTSAPRTSTPVQGADPSRAQRRIDYLKKNRPNDPEIQRLQKRVGSTAAAPAGQSAPPASKESIEQFLGGIFSGFKMPDFSGAPRVLQSGDIQSELQSTEQALLNENTRFLDRNRQRQMEEAKQEMANRGIPYDPAAAFDPNTRNLYGRTIGSIEEAYKGDMQSAQDRARRDAAERVALNVQTNKTAYDAFMDQAVKGFTSQLDAANTGNAVLNTLMQKYNIDQQTAQAVLDRAANERIARIRSAPSGGGGGGGEGGFQIL